ncbi:MAG: SapC family protein [Asticcacaulis sp.]
MRRHDLLEPFALDITLDDGSTNRFVGFHVIHEDRFQALDDDTIAELHREGHLMPIFMALASLANIGALVAARMVGW